MNARKAVELGFADEVLYEKGDETEDKPREVSVAFSQKMAANRVLVKIRGKPLRDEEKGEKEEKETAKTNFYSKYHEILFELSENKVLRQ
jgi:hypothetical protein